MRALTIGETMALLDPEGAGRPGAGTTFVLRVAGAESNFAIGLSRLGVETRWISRLGQDFLGDLVFDMLVSEGVDVCGVTRDAGAPTGVFFKWREGGRSHVLYHRRGSAAARLEPADVPDEALDGVQLVHLTGITMALSASARELVVDLAARAAARGITVLFDPNWRPALWTSAAPAAAAHREVLPYVDWYLCGADEGRTLLGTATDEETLEAARAAGARDAVVRIGARGALVRAGGAVRAVPPLRVTEVRDEVGAGDGFAAGFAYGLLQGWSAEDCASCGNVVAAAALAGTGDWETLPRLADVRDLLGRG
jgi:2-dehydro-3-deoxygluconokinase